MTTRNFDALFAPRSVALIGASNQPGSLGAVLARNLLGAGFQGPILPVNPHETSIGSALAYRSIAELPISPDLAVIATPAQTVPDLIGQLGARGCRAAVVVSAGFTADGAGLRQAMLDAAKPSLLRIMGPNCLGFISPSNGLNASFAHLLPKAGDIALVAQSGAVTTAALDWADERGFGFSRVATLGDMADIDFGDMLDYLAVDYQTKAILLYVESVTDARKFMSAAKIAARSKPVVVIKAGRSTAGAKAAFSHTGALAGADAVYDAAFRRAGLLRVKDLRELFDAVATLTAGMTVKGDRLAIMTNGGGVGVLATDTLDELGGQLAILGAEALAALNAVLPPIWSHGNPVDIIGDAPAHRYADAFEPLLSESGADAILVMSCPTAMTDATVAAQAIAAVVARHKGGAPVLTCWLGGRTARPARQIFADAGIASHETPDEAVRAFMHLADRAKNRALLMEAPPAGPAAPDKARARAIIDQAIADGRLDLSEPEAKAVLAAYGVPVLESRVAATPRAAIEAAAGFAGPYVLKILSPDISHKSDVGGVALNLPTAEAVGDAASAMLARVAKAMPLARIDGFVLQAMVDRPKARELIAGIAQDPTFGPVILFGQGGVSVEIVADRALALPPLNRTLALDMISRTRVAPLLRAYRDIPAADVNAVSDVLERLALMALDLPDLAELDINPLLADDKGVLGVDARIKLTRTPSRPAIKPYPEHLSHEVALEDGASLLMRAIRPDDEAGLIDFVARTAFEDVRLRFRGAVRQLPHEWAARLSQIDYDREMALVVLWQSDIVGVSRIAADPEGDSAEFALLVRSDWHHRGLGTLLMTAILSYARDRGLKEVWGEVEANNSRMLNLADALGFTSVSGEGPPLIRIVKTLARPLQQLRQVRT
jgi:acetyltransferase